MDKIYQITLILIVIFILCKILNEINNPFFRTINKYNPFGTPKVFTYIEEPSNFNNEKKIQLLSKNNDIPIFFQLCIKLMKQKISNLIVLTPKNYKQYVTNFPIKMCPTSEHPLKNRVELLSAYVLDKNGGLFISPGTIVNDMKDILCKVKSFDVVTFGKSKINPNTYLLGSQYNSDFIKLYKKDLTLKFLTNTEHILSNILQDNKFNQYHYSGEYDGTINDTNVLISINDYLGKKDIRYKNKNNLALISVPYEELLRNKEYYWFNNLSKEQFTSSMNDIYVSKLLKKLLKI